jgi:hypothetical protein
VHRGQAEGPRHPVLTLVEPPKKKRRRSPDIRYARLRRDALRLLGGVCVRCRFSDPRALQVDHKAGGGTKEQREIGVYGVLKRVITDPDRDSRYQLLCANCNWIKRHERNEWPRPRSCYLDNDGLEAESGGVLRERKIPFFRSSYWRRAH